MSLSSYQLLSAQLFHLEDEEVGIGADPLLVVEEGVEEEEVQYARSQ